jgi:exodeoxyribonuclease V beta subunit
MTPFDIVTASLEPGVTLIEASAGTGKTYSITGLILRLLLEERCPIREILAVTFTEAATQELRGRIRHRLQDALEHLRRGASDDPIIQAFLTNGDLSLGIRELDTALQSFDEAQIFTIHGFCQRMLNEYAFESGTRFDTALVTDPKPLFDEIARDFWRGRFYQARPLLPTLAMAWDKSIDNWVELLEQTRRHPDLIVIPPIAPQPCDELLRQIEAALAAAKKEWTGHQAEIEEILRHHKSLARNEKTFRADRVDELLPKLAEVFADFESANPESIRALSEVTTEAIAAGTKARSNAPVHLFFALSSEFCQSVDKLFNQLTHEFLAFAELELPKRKARTNTVTYDDLITSLRDALRGKEGQTLARAIRRKYSTALIDEFQDTDPAQYEIFRTIFGFKDHRLFFIGDPKQAVYGFRGADVFTYFEASKIADRKFTLVTNWRSEEPLLEAINGLFTRTEEPFIFPEIQYHPVHTPATPLVDRLTQAGAAPAALSFKLVQSQEDQGALNQEKLSDFIGESVSTDIAALHAAGALVGKRPLRYGDMAILVRSHRQAERLQSVLRKRRIRSIVQSDRNVFASEEARELQQFLQGVIDPRRDTLLKGALATTLLGFDATKLFALDRDDQERQNWLDRFSSWRQQWIDGCFTAMFRSLLVTQQVRARLVHLPAGERRLTNFLHLAELLHEAESTQSLAPDAVCSWLREQRESERVSEDRFQLRLESDDDAVQIATIHKCKGLEYPIVFCPFLWLPAESSARTELQFHDRSDPERRLTFDLRGKKAGAEEHREWQSEEIRAEELRLLYVAVTRAMNRCYIYLPDKNIDDSPLAQLFPASVDGSLVNEVLAFAKSSKGCVAASAAQPDFGRDALPRVLGQAEAYPSGSDASAHSSLKSRTFAGKISRIAMTASFTGLNTSATEPGEANAEASSGIGVTTAPERDDSDLSIFTFQRGRRTGDFFHDVLEQMDFQNLEGLSPLIDLKLRTYGFPETLHEPALNQILRQLMEVQLNPGMSLRDIPKRERLSEVEFSYPLTRLTPASLAAAFARSSIPAGEARTQMGKLRFDPIQGFMHGFIDLLCRFEDRFYLIDWKSNWLGSQPSDYDLEGMKRAMLEHNYYLQYHLYTLAADLLLEKRLPGYDYQTHFGGVFYIFLRGINPNDPSRGIFRDRPSAETVRDLRKLIS